MVIISSTEANVVPPGASSSRATLSETNHTSSVDQRKAHARRAYPRACCTWALLLSGIILIDIAVGRLVAVFSSLRPNLTQGFDEILQFGSLENVSQNVKSDASSAVGKCGVNAIESCAAWNESHHAGFNPSLEVDIAVERQQMLDHFGKTLQIVSKVANDKFFRAEMNSTAEQLNAITSTLTDPLVQDRMTCGSIVPRFCVTYEAAGELSSNMDAVGRFLNIFLESPFVEHAEDIAEFVKLFKVLTYAVALVIFMSTLRSLLDGCGNGGTNACRCSGSRRPLSSIVGLIRFIAFLFFLVASIQISLFLWDVDIFHVESLESEPSLRDLFKHIQTEYPAFYNLVLADLESAASLLQIGCFTFMAVMLNPCSPKRLKQEHGGNEQDDLEKKEIENEP